MMLDRRRFLATTALGLAAPFVLRGVGAAAEVALKLQHPLSAGSNLHQSILAPWATAIRDASGGALLVQVTASPAGAAGARPVHEQARDGVVDIACTPAGSSGYRAPRLETFELPFVAPARNSACASAIHEFAEKHAAEEFPELQLLTAWGQAHNALHAKKPVATRAAMEGMRLGSPTPMASRTLESLGAVAVSMRSELLADALVQGVLDGGALPWEVLPSLQIHATANAHTVLPGSPVLYARPYVLLMNEARFAGLPEPLRKVLLDNSGAVGARAAGQALDDRDAEVVTIARSRGEPIIEVRPEERARWIAATEPVIAGWLSAARAGGPDRQALIEEARTLLARYDPPATDLRGTAAPQPAPGQPGVAAGSPAGAATPAAPVQAPAVP